MARSIVGTAELHLKVISGTFASGIEKARKSTDRLKNKFKELQNQARDAGKVLVKVAAVTYATKKFFDLGAAVEETASKFATVFGPEAERVQEQLSGIATLAGQSQREMMDLVATTAAMAQGMGLSQRASADLGMAVESMAADFASFNNIPIQETAQSVQRALTGEWESMKRLGVAVNETMVQQRAMNDTGKTTAKQLTNQEKVAARLNLIYEQMGVQQGDLVRTADSAAARMRILEATIKDNADSLASQMLPALDWVLQRMLSLVTFTEKFGASMVVFGAQIKVAWETIKNVFGTNEGGLGAAQQALEFATIAAEEMFAELDEGVPVLTNLEEALRRVTDAANGEGGGGGAAMAFDNLAKKVFDYDAFQENVIRHLQEEVALFDVYAFNVGRTADEVNRLAEAQNKLSALGSAFGFLGRFINPLAGIASAFGSVTSGLDIVDRLGKSFGGGKAAGGPVSAGTAYLVGEQGPEMFMPSDSGTIIPNGGMSINVSMSAARNGSEALRDREWMRALQEGADSLKSNGYSFA